MKRVLVIALAVASVAANAQSLYNNATPAGLTQEGLRTGPRGAGGSYSEVQLGNTVAGFTARTAGFRLGDDFAVTGPGWNVSSVNVFGYNTGATTATINGGTAEIRTGSVTGSVVGTLSFGGSIFTDIYRHFNAQPGDTRRVQQITFNYAGPSLTAGTYWLTYDLNVNNSTTISPFVPSLTKVGAVTTLGANAQQLTVSSGVWANAVDGANPQDLPFWINGQAVPEPGTMIALGLGAAAMIRRRRK